jgi:heme-degrading monooxygenase HmoA
LSDEGDAVHVSMSKFRGEIDDLPGTARLASEAMLAWLQQIDGYRGLLALVDEEAGSAYFVTFWESEDALVKTRTSRSSLRDQMASTAGAEVVGTEEFVVAYSDGMA